MTLPPTYRSTATILVEDQTIPDDLVASLVNEFIDRRLETLTRRVLVTDNLLRLIEQHDLYADEREVLSPLQLADRMRDNTQMNVISTEVNDPERGRSGEVTVAFQLSFENGDPVKAQRVTNELVSLYLQTNLEGRRQQAEGTLSFLAAERNRVDERIAQLEGELLAFQQTNLGMLPEDVVIAQQQMIRLDDELRRLDREAQVLREREAFLQTQLAMTEEFTLADVDPRLLSPAASLEAARAELATARARYQPSHPDVIRLEREVRSLQALVGDQGGGEALLAQRAALQSELAGLRERYTPSHPDVVRAERQLAELETMIASSSNGDGATRNPAYIQLNAQLNAVTSEAASIVRQRGELVGQIERLQEVVARAPVVSQGYDRLVSALAEARRARESLVEKEATAQLGRSLESGAVGERLSLIEPPVFPERPESPNRKLIVAIGLVLGLGIGTGLAAAAELLDRSVRSGRELARLIGEKPLVMIPNLVSPGAWRRRLLVRIGGLAMIMLVVAGGLAVVHRTYVPLDVLAFQAQTRANTWLTTTFPSNAAPTATQE